MRYLVGLAAGCVTGLGIAASVAWAGVDEDCTQRTNDDLAIRACSEIIRRDRKAGWAYSNRGSSYRMKGDYDRSLADLNEAVRLEPRNAISLSQRGATYSAKGDYDRAIADLNQAIKLNPRDAFALGERGSAYRMKGDYDRAIADLSEAIRLEPRNVISLSERGITYSTKGDQDRAIADLSEAIRVSPNDILSYSERGYAYAQKGNRAKAKEDYKKALAIEAKTKWDRETQATVRQRLAEPDLPTLLAIPTLEDAPSAPKPALPKLLATPKLEDAPSAPKPAPVLTPSPSATPKEPTPPATATLTLSPPAAAPPPRASLGRRVALVIGNAGYKVGPLQNPGNDAAAIAEALEKQLKFDKVTLRLDLGRESFLAALREFSRDAAGAGMALVYYAGHATERRGKNFLIPIDARLDKASDLGVETVLLDTVLEQIEGATKLKMVILDSCRNNMFPMAGGDRGETRGLARIEDAGKNTLIAYAAKAGTVAADGSGRRHSPFTEALLKRIGTAGLEVRFLFGHVRDDVLAATAHQKEPQEPYVYGSLGGEQIFLRP